MDPLAVKWVAILYNNRAAAYLCEGRLKESVADCHEAISRDANYYKAYLRRARAFRVNIKPCLLSSLPFFLPSFFRSLLPLLARSLPASVLLLFLHPFLTFLPFLILCYLTLAFPFLDFYFGVSRSFLFLFSILRNPICIPLVLEITDTT